MPTDILYPTDASLVTSNNNYLTFTADTTETRVSGLDDTDGFFASMNTVDWTVEFSILNRVDDFVGLGIRVMNGATVLAAATSGGSFATVQSVVTSTTDITLGPTAFAYVNTTADKATWDGAQVELQQDYTAEMKADGAQIRVDFLRLDIDYVSSNQPPTLDNPTFLGGVHETAIYPDTANGTTLTLEGVVTDPDGDDVYATWQYRDGGGMARRNARVPGPYSSVLDPDAGGQQVLAYDYDNDRFIFFNRFTDEFFFCTFDPIGGLTEVGTRVPHTFTNSTTNIRDMSYRTGSGTLWIGETGTNFGQIREIDMTTGAEVTQFNSPFTLGLEISGVAWDGTDLWLTNNNASETQMKRVNTSGVTQQNYGLPDTFDRLSSLEWVGSDLWLMDDLTFSGARIMLWDDTDPLKYRKIWSVSTFAAYNDMFTCITSDGVNLYAFGTPNNQDENYYEWFIQWGTGEGSVKQVITPNTTPVASGTTHTTTWDVTGLTNDQSAHLEMTGWDIHGEPSTYVVSVTGRYVTNVEPPTPTIVTPTDGAGLVSNQNLQATVTDPQGEDFYIRWELITKGGHVGEDYRTVFDVPALNRWVSIAYDSKTATVWGTDTNDEVVQVNANGTTGTTFNAPGNFCQFMSYDPDRNELCFLNNSTIDTFYSTNKSGTVQTQWDLPAGFTATPRGMVYYGGEVHILADNGVVWVFTPAGSEVRQVTLTGQGRASWEPNNFGLEHDGTDYIIGGKYFQVGVYFYNATTGVCRDYVPAPPDVLYGQANTDDIVLINGIFHLTDDSDQIVNAFGIGGSEQTIIPINSTPVASGATHTTTWDTSEVTTGIYYLRAVAVDTDGQDSLVGSVVKVLIENNALPAQDSNHALTSDGVTLTEHATVTVQDSNHALTSDNATAAIPPILVSSQDSAHALSSDQAVLTENPSLTALDSNHSLQSDAVTLTEHASLTAADSNHSQIADEVTLTEQAAVTSEDSSHTMASDEVVLTPTFPVAVDGSAHALSSDEATLVEHAVLTALDSNHSLQSGTVTLTEHASLTVADSSHSQTADDVTLTEHATLAVQDSSHALTSDGATLTASFPIAVDESAHTHVADNVTITYRANAPPEDSFHTLTSDEVTLTETGPTYFLVVEETYGLGYGSNPYGGESATNPGAVHLHTSDEVTLTENDPLLAAQGSSHALTSDEVALTEHASLTIGDAAHGHTSDQATVTASYSLTAADSSHTHTSDEASLTEQATVTVEDSSHALASDEATLTEQAAVTSEDSNHSLISDSVTLTEQATLTSQDSQHAHTADASSLAEHATLTSADASHAHSADQASITEIPPLLLVDDSQHAHTADKSNVLPEHSINGEDGNHTLTSDEVSLTEQTTVTAEDSSHALTSDEATLTEHATVTVGDSNHGLASDEVTLTEHATVAPQDSTHGHTSDSSTLSATYALAPADSSHALTSDESSLTEQAVVTAESSVHGHTSEEASVSADYTATPADAAHTLTSDEVTLTEQATVAVADASHALASDEVTLTEQGVTYSVITQDSTHGLTSDEVVLTEHASISGGDATHALSSDEVTLTEHASVSVADSNHVVTSGQATTSVDFLLSSQDASHALSSDEVSLTEAASVTVADSNHTHTSDESTVASAYLADGQDSNHGFASDQVALTEHAVLSVEDSLHAHTSDKATAIPTGSLDVQDSNHGLASDEVTLAEHATVSVEDSQHQHTSDQPGVASTHGLLVQDSQHGHTSESSSLAEHATVGVNDATHAHVADESSIAASYSLAVDDSSHGLASDEALVIEQSALVLPEDASHTLQSGTVTLTQSFLLDPGDSLHTLRDAYAWIFYGEPRVVEIRVEAGPVPIDLQDEEFSLVFEVDEVFTINLEAEGSIRLRVEAEEEAI